MPNKTITFGTDLLPLRDKGDSDGGFNLGTTGQAWNIYGNLTGNASTSTSWANSQTVYVDLTSSGDNSSLNGGQSSAQVLKVNGTLGIGNGGTGVTSVNPHQILIGPSSGSSAGAPTWRALDAADIPDLSANYLPLTGGTLTGNLIVTNGYVTITSQDYSFRKKITDNYEGATQGWARKIIEVTDNSNNGFATIGVRGTGSTFNYWYMGDQGYNGDNLRVYSGGITWSPSFSVSAGSNVSNGGKYTITTTGVEYGKLTGSTSGAAILWSKRVIGLYPGKTDDDTATPASDYQSTNKYFFFTDVFRTDSNGTINIGSTTKKFKDIHSVTNNSTEFALYSDTTKKAHTVYNTTDDTIDFVFD